jgi:AAA15 family ATPase/GTPase
MIVNFGIKNFGSFKEEQFISFEADKSKHLESSYIINVGNLRLLKLALIYGANASGKSTLLKALDFLRSLILEPASKKTDELNFQPFLFESKNKSQHSKISIEFIAREVRYFYEVEFFSRAIVQETLTYFNPNKAIVFKRSTDLDNQLTEIKFGSKIKIDRTVEKNLEANTLWNNTVLGGFLKTNVDIQELKHAVEWFKKYLRPLILPSTQLESFVTSKIDKGEISKFDVINILNKADFNISDVLIREEKKEIPKALFDFFKTEMMANYSELAKLQEKGSISSVTIEFEHTVNKRKYKLPIEMESHGTRRYYGFSGLLAILIRNSTAFPIDELESSLHPDLYNHFLLLFLLNSENSQIIATTHNREWLDNKDLFRNDSIWFTHKNDDSSTELYSLNDFDTTLVRNTTNILNAYKSGKLKATPNLGDLYLELKK